MSETGGNVNRSLPFLDVDGPLNPYASTPMLRPQQVLRPSLNPDL